MPPELLVVSGPNACGKTTFIHRHEKFFLKEKFTLVIPDEINAEYGQYNASAVSNKLMLCQQKKESVVYETLLQNPDVIKNVTHFKDLGYRSTLFQLFVETIETSALRVEDRKYKGGLQIPSKEVQFNFSENFENVASYHFLFDEILFIDATDFMQLKIVGAYANKKITYYKSNRSVYIKNLLKKIIPQCNSDEKFLSAFANNKDFGSLTQHRLSQLIKELVPSSNN